MVDVKHTLQTPPSYDNAIAIASSLTTADSQLARLRDLMAKYEIRQDLVTRLRGLEDYDIVFVCDDSGSMGNKCNLGGDDIYAHRQSRWDELKDTVRTVVDIAITLDSDGIDLYFLNQGPALHNVTTLAQVDKAFASRSPTGYTPLQNTLRQVFIDKQGSGDMKKLLVIVATDGEPTTVSGRADREGVQRLLQIERPDHVYVSIAAMTDDAEVMETLNDWDENLQRLDVVDDYASERQQIKTVQGSAFPFSRGDYICKILLGSVDPWVDSWDETPVNLATGALVCNIGGQKQNKKQKRKKGCTIL